MANPTIMIVEDNDVNQELIHLMIDQYSTERDEPLTVLTAQNGKEAVDLCHKHTVDLVFMDIMMPTMNGSEATRIIKENHPHTMIVVISTFGDDAKQKEMLRNGAEDYMVKPIKSPLFKSRLANYLQLIEHRNHIQDSPKSINLFTSKVYSYHMQFRIHSKGSFAEFWEALLVRLDFQRHMDNLSDLVRFFYRITMLQLHYRFQFHIYIEEDADHFYFTIDNIKLIGCEKLQNLIQRHYREGEYVCKGNLITFALRKSTDRAVAAQVDAVKTEIQPTVTTATQTLQTYDILDDDELETFDTHLHELRSIMLMMESSTLEPQDTDRICHSFEALASITAMSHDTYLISNALKELAATISQNEALFFEKSDMLYEFINAFVNDLIFWKKKIFIEGAPSVDFLNDSIITNANMLAALLKPDTLEENDVDDIFDF